MIKIIKNVTRSSIQFQYDPIVLALIKPIEKKYWDPEKKTWTIPNSSVDEFIEKLKLKSYKVDLTEHKAHADMIDNGETIDFTFNTFIPKLDKIRELECVYDFEEKKWTCSINQLQNLVDAFNDLNITHSIKLNVPKHFDIPDSQIFHVPKAPKKQGRPKQ